MSWSVLSGCLLVFYAYPIWSSSQILFQDKRRNHKIVSRSRDALLSRNIKHLGPHRTLRSPPPLLAAGLSPAAPPRCREALGPPWALDQAPGAPTPAPPPHKLRSQAASRGSVSCGQRTAARAARTGHNPAAWAGPPPPASSVTTEASQDKHVLN